MVNILDKHAVVWMGFPFQVNVLGCYVKRISLVTLPNRTFSSLSLSKVNKFILFYILFYCPMGSGCCLLRKEVILFPCSQFRGLL